MWDGIENAGYGMHSNESSTWVDLASGRNMTISNAAYLSGWREYGFVFNNDAYFQNTGTTNDNILHLLGSTWTIFFVATANPSILTIANYNGGFGNTNEGSGYGLQAPQYNRPSDEQYAAFGNYPRASGVNGIEFPFSSITPNKLMSFAIVGTPTKYALYVDGTLYSTSVPGST